jgi:hypothetical protein
MKMRKRTSENLRAKIRYWLWKFAHSFWFKILGIIYWRDMKKNPEKAYRYLPLFAPFLRAVPFFAVFTCLFERYSDYESREHLLARIYDVVDKARKFTQDDLVIVSRCFTLSVAYLLDDQSERGRLLAECLRCFPRTTREFHELYQQLHRNWGTEPRVQIS